MVQIVLVVLVGLISSSWGLEPRYIVKTSIHEDVDPPGPAPRDVANITTAWIDVPLDHFDPQNNVTFRMRYAYNEQFFGGEGCPIFLMAGGYGLGAGWLLLGNMFEMAKENKGFMLKTEYRYYGESIPFQNFTTHNMRFLNMDQALADVAFIIGDLKKQPRFRTSKIIMYGGSKAANMVTWFKQRFQHLVLGVVASSGPYLAKIDFPEYLEVVHEAYTLEGGEECINVIRQGIRDTVEAMKTESGRRTLEQAYRFCDDKFDYENRLDLGYFTGTITWTFSGSVQTATPGSLMTICNRFTSNASDAFGSTPMQKVGGFVAQNQGLGPTGCWDLKYERFLASYLPRSDSRSWYFQTCTEFGYFQTVPRSGTVFDPLEWLDVDFYLDICKNAFDPKFDLEFANNGAKRSNRVYGGLSPDVQNTINIHGYIDPWRALGVYREDLHRSSPTYTAARASHCFDMGPWAPSDTISMIRIQQQARRTVASWLRD